MKSVRILVLVAVSVALLGLGNLACNTTEGAGKDIKATGRAIENTAHDAND